MFALTFATKELNDIQGFTRLRKPDPSHTLNRAVDNPQYW